jgi:hypothetical protein
VEVVPGMKLERARIERVGRDVLCVSGAFVYETEAEIARIPNPESIKLLVVDSGGGLVAPAIRLAKVIEQHRWTVVVSRNCYSSCANYVFLANVEKVVLPNSFVGWHGLPPPIADMESAFAVEGVRLFVNSLIAAGLSHDEARNYVLQMSRSSEEFFASRSISPDLARAKPVVATDDQSAYAARYRAAAEQGPVNWSYSKRMLIEKWNVQHIRYMWEPTDKTATTDLFKKSLGWELFFFG